MNNILDYVDPVVQWIILYGPTIVAAIGSVTGIVIAVKKLIKGSEDTLAESKKIRAELARTNNLVREVMKENANLKKENAEIKADIHKIYRGN